LQGQLDDAPIVGAQAGKQLFDQRGQSLPPQRWRARRWRHRQHGLRTDLW
jgi:hypothetical protein